jgi:uncharacterized membrane protein
MNPRESEDQHERRKTKSDFSQLISSKWQTKAVFQQPASRITGLSWLCYFRALQLGEASQVSPVDKLSVAIALAAIFLREQTTWHHWGGRMLIFVGAVVLAYA